MGELQLDAKKTALVIIDLQNAVLATPTAPHASAEVIERSKRLAEKFREKGALVVFVRVDFANFLRLPVDVPPFPPNAPLPPASAFELSPSAGVQAGDLVIAKRHWGAFAGTELEQELRAHGVDTVVLTGVATNIGVESTARQGTGLGFAFVIVEDACSARDESSHRWSVEKIFPRMARVRKTDEVIAAMG